MHGGPCASGEVVRSLHKKQAPSAQASLRRPRAALLDATACTSALTCRGSDPYLAQVEIVHQKVLVNAKTLAKIHTNMKKLINRNASTCTSGMPL